MISSRTPSTRTEKAPSVSRRAFTAAALSGAAAMALPALAQQYPAKTIRLVVPFGAGDPPDIYARVLVERLSPLLGQQVIVDNKPGAAGAIGAAEVAKAPADGYTLLYASAAMMVITPQLRTTPYDPVKDFEPVSRVISGAGLTVTVNSSFPASTWPEFVAEVKRNPNKYSIISSGEGSFLHLAAIQLQDAAGIQLLHVPYKSFSQGVTDLRANQVNVTLELAAALPHIKAGAMKALLVLDDKPNPDIPNVPTLKQYPMPFNQKVWFGIVAPAGTPKAAVERLQAALSQVVGNDPAYASRLPTGMFASYAGGAEFAGLMSAEYATYGAMIKRLNLKLD